MGLMRIGKVQRVYPNSFGNPAPVFLNSLRLIPSGSADIHSPTVPLTDPAKPGGKSMLHYASLLNERKRKVRDSIYLSLVKYMLFILIF